MALFQRQYVPVAQPVRVQYVRVPVVPVKLDPAIYKNISAICGRHGMPIPLNWAGWGKTPTGYPTARYMCPLCGHEEGYGRDHQTGQPRRLYAKG